MFKYKLWGNYKVEHGSFKKKKMAEEVLHFESKYGRVQQLTVFLWRRSRCVSYVTGKAKACAEWHNNSMFVCRINNRRRIADLMLN